MGWLCRYFPIAFLALYLVALGLLAIGTFGLFGQEKDPLAGVFLMPLGLPWNLWFDFFPERAWPFLAAAAPALNLALASAVCRAMARRTPISAGGGQTARHR